MVLGSHSLIYSLDCCCYCGCIAGPYMCSQRTHSLTLIVFFLFFSYIYMLYSFGRTSCMWVIRVPRHETVRFHNFCFFDSFSLFDLHTLPRTRIGIALCVQSLNESSRKHSSYVLFSLLFFFSTLSFAYLVHWARTEDSCEMIESNHLIAKTIYSSYW